MWTLVGTALLALALVAAAACHSRRVAPWERVPLKPGQIDTVHLSTGPDFQVDRVRFYSEEEPHERFFLVLTPVSAAPVRNVFVLNHGWKDRPEDLISSLHVDTAYGELLKQGRVVRARLVLPDMRFPEEYRRDEAKYPFKQYLVMVGEEVAGLVSKLYDVPFDRTRWGVGGFSFGGYAALDIVRRYPGRFGSASVVSSFYDGEWTFWPSQPPAPGQLDTRGRGKQNIVLPGPVPRLMLACGTSDGYLAQMRGLHDRLTSLGIPHEWSTGAGGHTWTYWGSVIRSMLVFHLSPDAAGSR